MAAPAGDPAAKRSRTAEEEVPAEVLPSLPAVRWLGSLVSNTRNTGSQS